MESDITPKLDQLKKEKSDFINFQKLEGELERLQRLKVAFDYFELMVREWVHALIQRKHFPTCNPPANNTKNLSPTTSINSPPSNRSWKAPIATFDASRKKSARIDLKWADKMNVTRWPISLRDSIRRGN